MNTNGHPVNLVLECKCGFKMRVTAAHLGKTGKCTGCGERITVTEENTRRLAEADTGPTQEVPDSPLQAAVALIKSQQYEEAKTTLEALLEQDETDPNAWYSLAYCHYKLSDFAQARLLAERAVLQGSEHAETLLRKIDVKARVGASAPESVPSTPPSLAQTAGSLRGASPAVSEPPGGTPPSSEMPASSTSPREAEPAGPGLVSSKSAAQEMPRPEASVLRQDSVTTKGDAGIPAPTAIEETGVLEDPEQRCVIGTELDPITLKQAARKRGDLSFPVVICPNDDTLSLGVKELPKARLGGIIAAQLPWLILGLVFLFGKLMLMILDFFLIFACAFGLNLFGAMMCMYSVGMRGLDLLISGVQYVIFVFRVGRLGFFFASGQPCVFVPAGVSVNNGAVAQFHRNQSPQVLRFNLSKTLLGKRTKQEKMQGCGCIALPVFLLFRAGMVAFDILLGMLTVQREEYTLFAFVVGDPVDLTPRPTGFLERMKARREKRGKQKHTIFFVNVDPDKADGIHQRVERSLGVTVQTIDDTIAEQTFWA